MGNEKSVQNVKELAIGLIVIATMLAEEFKDGVQATDAISIFAKIKGNEELQAKILLAYNGIDQVSAEAKDINLSEGVELIVALIPEIKKMIEAISKPKA
jgi:hypothetical protein